MVLVLVSLFALTGFAVAQDLDLGNYRLWFENPVFFIGAIVAITSWVREKFNFIDGKVQVGAVSVGIGVVAGLLADWWNWITVIPFAEMNFPLGGILYGALAGFSAVLGVSLFDFFVTRVSEKATEAKLNNKIPEGGTK